MAEVDARARERGFAWSCAPEVGRLLAVPAAGVRPGGRVLELGTGAGTGTARIGSGVALQAGVEFVTVERDRELAEHNAALAWPEGIEFRVGDIVELLPSLGTFDLIFADAEGGKWTGLDRTIDALRPGGMVIVDDMDPAIRYEREEHRRAVAAVRRTLTEDPRLIAVELAGVESGVILATRRRTDRRAGRAEAAGPPVAG